MPEELLHQILERLTDIDRRQATTEAAYGRLDERINGELKQLVSLRHMDDTLRPIEEVIAKLAAQVGSLALNMDVLTRDITATNKRVTQVFDLAEAEMRARAAQDKEIHDMKLETERATATAQRTVLEAQAQALQEQLAEQKARNEERRWPNRVKTWGSIGAGGTAVVLFFLLVIRIAVVLLPHLAEMLQSLTHVSG